MIDSMLSLVFSVHSNKGVYALLLGSGISRAAGIPTGWEVVLDLIRKLASIQEEDCEPDPVAWYKVKYNTEPDYSDLLNLLANSPAERNQLLRGYFEPTQEEHEQGMKIPTEAHKAIANLVADGYIRVIVTTNFDRLLEKALEAVGVTPTVISTPDAVEGALPLVHTSCSIIKVHGDYLDTRIKNTPEELSEYDDRINHLLDRIFDEYGLIVCGWSAEWDTALCKVIEHCRNHRFTTYWTIRGELGQKAQSLTDLRRAKVISIKDADEFFFDLAEKVFALDQYSHPHPLSAKLAVARLKKYLVDDSYKIRLHDLVMQEVEKLYGELSDEHFLVQGVRFNNPEGLAKELNSRVKRYEALTEVLQAMIITGCYWGEKAHKYLWSKSLERIANPLGNRTGSTLWLNLKMYPALLLLYAGGIAALADERYSTFATLLTKPKIQDEINFGEQPLLLLLSTWEVMRKNVQELLPGMKGHHTPLSDYLYQVLREPLRELLPQDIRYQKCFDRFEYLLALVFVDLYQGYRQIKSIVKGSVPIGSFWWRRRDNSETHIMNEIALEVREAGGNWPLLEAGLFDSSVERFLSLKTDFDKEFLSDRNWRYY